MEHDYSKEELIKIIEVLLNEHAAKLKCIEWVYLNQQQALLFKDVKLEQYDRDIIIRMYDSIGEGGY